MSNKFSYMAGIAAVVALGAVPVLAQEAPAQQPPAAAPAAKEPPPVLPTTGDGAVITTLLTKVCSPLVEGGDFVTLAKAAGLTKDRKSEAYILPLAQRPFQISMTPPSERNKNVCEMRVRYAPGWDQPILESMNIWRFLHTPQLSLQRNDIGQSQNAQRITTTWDNWDNQSADGKMVGLILVQLNASDGKPVDPTYDEAIVQYSVRAAQAAQPVAQTPAAPAAPAG